MFDWPGPHHLQVSVHVYIQLHSIHFMVSLPTASDDLLKTQLQNLLLLYTSQMTFLGHIFNFLLRYILLITSVTRHVADYKLQKENKKMIQ